MECAEAVVRHSDVLVPFVSIVCCFRSALYGDVSLKVACSKALPQSTYQGLGIQLKWFDS